MCGWVNVGSTWFVDLLVVTPRSPLPCNYCALRASRQPRFCQSCSPWLVACSSPLTGECAMLGSLPSAAVPRRFLLRTALTTPALWLNLSPLARHVSSLLSPPPLRYGVVPVVACGVRTLGVWIVLVVCACGVCLWCVLVWSHQCPVLLSPTALGPLPIFRLSSLSSALLPFTPFPPCPPGPTPQGALGRCSQCGPVLPPSGPHVSGHLHRACGGAVRQLFGGSVPSRAGA
jgi:hypothetical protein